MTWHVASGKHVRKFLMDERFANVPWAWAAAMQMENAESTRWILSGNRHRRALQLLRPKHPLQYPKQPQQELQELRLKVLHWTVPFAPTNERSSARLASYPFPIQRIWRVVLDKLVSKLLMDVRSASVLWAAALQMEAAVDSKILLHRRPMPRQRHLMRQLARPLMRQLTRRLMRPLTRRLMRPLTRLLTQLQEPLALHWMNLSAPTSVCKHAKSASIHFPILPMQRAALDKPVNKLRTDKHFASVPWVFANQMAAAP